MNIILKRHEDSSANEFLASMRSPNYRDYIEDIDEVESGELIDDDDL